MSGSLLSTRCPIFAKVTELQSSLANERGRASSSSQELAEAKSRVESLVTKVSELESSNLKLNQKISDLAQTIDDKNSTHRGQVFYAELCKQGECDHEKDVFFS